MTRKSDWRVAIWCQGDQEFDDLAFMFFVLSMNKHQKSISFHFPDDGDENLPTYQKLISKDRAGEQPYDDDYDLLVFVTKQSMEGNLFFRVDGKIALITTSTWQRYFSPPSIFEYLVHSILCAAVYSFSAFQVESHSSDTRGCQFEYTRIKDHDRIDIAMGHLCTEHHSQMIAIFGKKFLNDFLLLVSFGWLGTLDDKSSVRYRMKDYFKYDIDKDSGYKKSFFERAVEKLDSMPLEFAKEILKGIIFIFTAYLLVRFGLRN